MLISLCFIFFDFVFYLGIIILVVFFLSFFIYKNLFCFKIERKEYLLVVNNWMSKYYFEIICLVLKKEFFFLFKFSLFKFL